ncbi:MAG TPA: GNAT family N-acetyltransferase [Candidatus Limnocylindrales bacterium]
MPEVTLAQERPDHPDAESLVLELEDHLASRYPAESRHGFSVQQLLDQGVDFFVLRDAGAPAACGGILFVEGQGREPYGEVKRMYTRDAYRGRGYGRRVLARLLEHARDHGVTLVRLETGIDQVEAIGLYESMGFRRCPPFGPYRDDPLSPTYELRLEA